MTDAQDLIGLGIITQRLARLLGQAYLDQHQAQEQIEALRSRISDLDRKEKARHADDAPDPARE